MRSAFSLGLLVFGLSTLAVIASARAADDDKPATKKQAAENQAAENQAAENQAAENQAAEKQAAEKQAAEKQAGSGTDRYEIPTGDSAELVRFIDSLQQFRPRTLQEYQDHLERAPKAIQTAAEKLLALEKDKQSAAAQKARQILLQIRVQDLAAADRDAQAVILQQVKEFLHSAAKLERLHLAFAYTTASRLEQSGASALAADAYETFGALFSRLPDDALVETGQQMLSAARRVRLPGHEIKVTGQTVAGKEFDWSQYRGKVVLIDFWATWCGPCIEELPNVIQNYERYHKRGFDVVGISLDEDRMRLESFLQERQIPWVTLFEEGAGWEQPTAKYYGVMAVPTVILVDPEGKVVSMNARGSELGRQLAQLMGPPEPGAAEPGAAERGAAERGAAERGTTE